MQLVESGNLSRNADAEEAKIYGESVVNQAGIKLGWIPGERQWGLVDLNWEDGQVTLDLMQGVYKGVTRNYNGWPPEFPWSNFASSIAETSADEQRGPDYLDAVALTTMFTSAAHRLPPGADEALLHVVNEGQGFGYPILSKDKKLQKLIETIGEWAPISGPMGYTVEAPIKKGLGFAIMKAHGKEPRTLYLFEGEGQLTIEQSVVRNPRGNLSLTQVVFQDFPKVRDIKHQIFKDNTDPLIHWDFGEVAYLLQELGVWETGFLQEYLPKFITI